VLLRLIEFSTGAVVSVMIPPLGSGQREVFAAKQATSSIPILLGFHLLPPKILPYERVSRVAATAAIAVFDLLIC
jgi:hypothetical protein